MPQELFTVIQSRKRGGLLIGRSHQHQEDQGMAMIGRKMHLGNGRRTDARVGHFVADQLFQFFANTFGEALIAVGVQVSG